MSTQRVLVINTDTLPYPGYPTTGAGLRAWGLGEGLRSRGHHVCYTMPARSTQNRPRPEDPDLYLIDSENMGPSLVRAVEQARPDVVVFEQWHAVPHLAHLDLPIAIDFHGPLILEVAFQNRPGINLLAHAEQKVRALARGDFFTCAGELQKKYFLGWLLMAGVDLTQGDVIYPIPVSLSPEQPEHTWPNPDVNFVYGGVFLPWQDPSVGIKALLAELDHAGKGRLDFFGGKHIVLSDLPTGIYADLLPLLAASPYVTIHGMVPRDDLVQKYLTSYVALDLMARNYERELAFTTRTAEYLWCGLAVVYAEYGELASYIRDYEAGWIVSPERPDEVARTLREIIANPQEAQRRGRNAQRLAREKLLWDKTIDPLDQFCRNPVRRRSERAQELKKAQEQEAATLRLPRSVPMRQKRSLVVEEMLRHAYAARGRGEAAEALAAAQNAVQLRPQLLRDANFLRFVMGTLKYRLSTHKAGSEAEQTDAP